MKNRLLTILMSMLMVFVMMPMGTWTTYAAGGNLSQDADGYYLIEDYNDLKAFAEHYAQGYNARLTNDIICTDDDWVTIGNGSDLYAGTFDGDGHIIKGLSNKSSGAVADTQGLIGLLGFGGKVINVGIEGGSITGTRYVGSIVGINFGEIINCYNTGEINGTETRVGGIAGMNYGVIKNCYNTGKISVTENYIGGITGYNTYDNFLENEAEITNCYNTGSISCTEEGYAGGIAGLNERAKITNCYNTGKVSSAGTGACGVVGINIAGGKIENCYFDKTLNPGLRTVYNNSGEVDRNSVISLPTTQMTGTNALRYMPFTNQDPWLTKADGEDPDTSEYYRYYPHLKGFNFDSDGNQVEASDITPADWPSKETVKAEWNGSEPYIYNGSAQGSLKQLTISNGSTTVTADPDKDYTVKYYKQIGIDAETREPIWSADAIDVAVNAGSYKAVITFKAGGHTSIEKRFEISKAPLTITANDQTYLYTGQTQGEGDTVYVDPGEIAAKVEVTGLKEGDVLESIQLFSQGQAVYEYKKSIKASAAKIMRGTADVTDSYEITYVNGDMTIVGPEVQVKKTIDGRDWTDADSYEFTLSPVNGAPMPNGTTGDKITLTKADKDAGFTKGFGAIPFTQPGTYKYTVTETHKGETIKGVSYDSSDKTVTFEIKGDDKGNVVADGSTLLQTAEFTNTYNANGEVRLKASKSVSGSDRPEGAEATFTLSSHDGAPMPDNTSVTLTAPGDAEFGPIIYDLSDAGKTYTYTISETGTKGFDDWFTDKESVSVAVTVGTDKGDGTLSDAVVTYTPENTEITNTSVQWKFISITWTGDEASGYTGATANYESTNTAGRTKTVKADISEKVTDPTCTEDGKTEYTATVSKENSPDGEAHSESRDAKPTSKTGHSLTKTDEVPATCDKAGTKAYWTCSKCKKMFSDEKGENEIKAPEIIMASGHDWGEWTVTKEATETEDGEEQRVCKNDPEHKETRVIPATGHVHKLTETPAKAATCTEDGNSAYWKCDKGDNPCGKYFSDAEGTKEIEKDSWVIKASGHDWGEWTVTKEATETEEGEEQRVCKNDPEHKEARVIPVIGHEHKLTETPAKAATCTEDGNSAYWTCDKGDNPCGRYFSDAEGTTEIEKDSWVITATGHDWGEWTVTKEATETEEGEEQRVCKNDPEHKETRAIPVIPTSVTYSNVSGEGNIWYKGSDVTSDFAFKRSIDDASTLSHFTGIRVDNKAVDEANYSKESGSVIIKLKPEYLETLALGKHTLEARFDDGNGSATAEFTIAEAEEENTDDEDDNGGGSKGSKKNVNTGDESLVAFWASLLGVSLIGLFMLFAARQRLRRKD